MSGMKVVFGRDEQDSPSLFAGHAWMDAAEEWAREQGLHVRQWQVDQRFRAAERGTMLQGCWYRITWHDGEGGQLGQWEVQPCE